MLRLHGSYQLNQVGSREVCKPQYFFIDYEKFELQ